MPRTNQRPGPGPHTSSSANLPAEIRWWRSWETGPALRRALASRPSLEARRRIERLLARLDRTPKQVSPLPVGTLRALRVLEQIRNAEARAVLQDLADWVEDLPTAAEASAALARIGARTPSHASR